MTLLFGLAVVQGLGLTIHAYDSIGLQHFAEARDIGVRISTIFRVVTNLPPEQRARALRELELPSGWRTSCWSWRRRGWSRPCGSTCMRCRCGPGSIRAW